jgi:hypothetical protein
LVPAKLINWFGSTVGREMSFCLQLHDCTGGHHQARTLPAEVRNPAQAANMIPSAVHATWSLGTTEGVPMEHSGSKDVMCNLQPHTYRFSVGGFAPGVAVQPVLLDYSANRHFNPGWGLDESTPWHFWRLLTQLRTHIRLKILPVRHSLLHFVLHRCEADQAAAPVSSDTTPEPSRALRSALGDQ